MSPGWTRRIIWVCLVLNSVQCILALAEGSRGWVVYFWIATVYCAYLLVSGFGLPKDEEKKSLDR